MTKKIKQFILFFLLSFIYFNSNLFCQNYNPFGNEHELPLEELENQTENLYNPKLQDNFTIIMPKNNYNLDPHTSSYSYESQILNGLYEGLFTYNPQTLEPEFAYAINYKISRDKKRWTFELRKDAYFSNGTPITANEVKNSWIELLSNQNAPYSSLLDIIKGAKEYRLNLCSKDKVGINVVDDYHISLYLTRPASYLPKLLCINAFSVINQNPTVYSGPFIIEDFSNEGLILKKNEYYYDKKNTILNKITFIFSDDINENTFLFNMGKADWITGANANIKGLLAKDITQISAEFATEFFFFKEQENSIWNNKLFRSSLLEAIPWDKLRENTFVKAQTLVPPLNGYPMANGYSYTDMLEAKSLMKEAREKTNISQEEIIPIIFAITENQTDDKRITILKEAWKELNVELQTVVVPSSIYLNSIKETNAHLFSYIWIGDFADPLAFLDLFKSDSTLNVSNWKNQKYDELLFESNFDQENYLKILSQAEQILLDEAIIIPIQHPVSFNIINYNSSGGWFTNSFNLHPLKYLFKKQTKMNLPNVVINY